MKRFSVGSRFSLLMLVLDLYQQQFFIETGHAMLSCANAVHGF